MSGQFSKEALVATAFTKVGRKTHVTAIARFAATCPVLLVVRAIEIDPGRHRDELRSQFLSQLLSQLHSL